MLPTASNTPVAASATPLPRGKLESTDDPGWYPSEKGESVTAPVAPRYSHVARLFDFLAFSGILSIILTLACLGTGAASIASIAALVGVCGRIWVAISRPMGTSRKDKANVTLAPGDWRAEFETER